MLTVIDYVPDGFLDASAAGLHQVLPGPTLIHLRGRKREPLFVSVLLHGNEYSGLTAIQNVLGRYATSELPRSLSIFVGNVQAAALGQRRLDGQPDYNRVWPGVDPASGLTSTQEYAMMAQVVDDMRARRVFASIDIHNNTGLNPHYACVNVLQPEFLHLATLFSQTAVYFLRPLGVQSAAFARICPATTVECGKPGDAIATAHAQNLVDAALHLDHFPSKAISPNDINLFHTVAIVKIPAATSFHFGPAQAELQLEPTLDHMNFRELAAGTIFGRVTAGSDIPIVALDENGNDVTAQYFEVRDGALRIRRRTMPSMLTLDERIIRQDCLCYLMERIALPQAAA